MALDRWIALAFVGLCIAYGYGAYFTLDAGLPPFMRNNPVKPSTFPKILAVCGAVLGLVVLLGLEKSPAKEPGETDIDLRRLGEYNLSQALILLGLMVAYALALRPLGFLPATILFVISGSFTLGERKWITMILAASLVAYVVWFLVQITLEIYLVPLPVSMDAANDAFISANETAWEGLFSLFDSPAPTEATE